MQALKHTRMIWQTSRPQTGAFPRLYARWVGGMERLAEAALGLYSSDEAELPTTSRMSAPFAAAMRGASRSADEWFWLSRELSDERERLWCLRRALEINPGHTLARSALLRVGG